MLEILSIIKKIFLKDNLVNISERIPECAFYLEGKIIYSKISNLHTSIFALKTKKLKRNNEYNQRNIYDRIVHHIQHQLRLMPKSYLKITLQT